MKKDLAVGCVVYKQDKSSVKFLVIRKSSDGGWEFPKGHPEEGENAQDTLKRELMEETGIFDITIKAGFKEKVNYIAHTEKGVFDKTVLFFLVNTKQEKVVLSEEHNECKWLEYNKAREQLSYDDLFPVLDKANDFLQKKAK